MAFALLATCLGLSPAVANAGIQGKVLDDPKGVLGDEHLRAKEAARAAGFRVSVVPGLRGRSYREVISNRLSALARRGSPGDLLLLLSLNQRVAIFGVRNPSKLKMRQGARKAKRLLRQRQRASLSATRAFRRSGAGAAVLAGARGLRSQAQDSGDGVPQIEIGWKAIRWLVLLLLAFALVNLVRALRARRRLQAFSGGAFAIRDLSAGTAVISGTVQSSEPLQSRITGSPCVYCEYSVSEDWEGSDSKGTVTLDSGNSRVQFEVHDATGKVLILPNRARITSPQPVEMTVDRSSPYYEVAGVGGLPFRYSGDSTGIRHLSESIIAVGSQVTVVGPVAADESGARVEWNRRLGPSPARPFLITHHEPGWAEHFEKKRMKRFFVFSSVSLIVALVLALVSAS